MLLVAALASGLLLTACGSGAHSASTATTTGGDLTGSAGRSDTAVFGPPGPLAFARCMRASGIPNFPDPRAGHGALFPLPNGSSPNSPAFRAAQQRCQKLMSGVIGAVQGPPPSAHTLVKLRRIAQCLRQHGISQFPDPRASKPTNVNAGTYDVITDYDGAFLLFGATLNLEAPAYKQALAACHAPPLGLPH
jgi:hypothetical protein